MDRDGAGRGRHARPLHRPQRAVAAGLPPAGRRGDRVGARLPKFDLPAEALALRLEFDGVRAEAASRSVSAYLELGGSPAKLRAAILACPAEVQREFHAAVQAGAYPVSAESSYVRGRVAPTPWDELYDAMDRPERVPAEERARALATALSKFGEDLFEDDLRPYLRDPRADVRAVAVAGTESWRCNVAEAELLRLASDPDSAVLRAVAARAAACGLTRVLDRIGMADPSAAVRPEAARPPATGSPAPAPR